jgi:hypothetical protein
MVAVADAQMRTADRYEFAADWRRFLRNVDPDQTHAAERSLLAILWTPRSPSFNDVGCDSGLFSLAPMRLGAERVHSFDILRASRARKRCVPRVTEPATGASKTRLEACRMNMRRRRRLWGFLQRLAFIETWRRQLDPSENGCNGFVLTKDRSADLEPAW